MTTKICTSCKTEKAVAVFHHFGKSRAQVGKWCEDCYQKKKSRSTESSKVGHVKEWQPS